MSATGKTTYPPLGMRDPKLVVIAGTFLQNGSSDPNVIIGSGFTVTYVSAGKYTITLDRTYHRCISCVVSVGESTSSNLFKVTREEIDLTTTFSSFVVHFQSTVTDTATDLQQCSFICVVSDTSISAHRTS